MAIHVSACLVPILVGIQLFNTERTHHKVKGKHCMFAKNSGDQVSSLVPRPHPLMRKMVW